MSPAYSQTFGEIPGTVGDVTAGAKVTISNTATGAVGEVETNEAGNYNVPFLNPGIYNLTAEIDGFKVASVKNRRIQVGEAASQINVTTKSGGNQFHGTVYEFEAQF